MNNYRKHPLTLTWLERMPLIIAAALLLRATWLPVIEIKGFDTFVLETVAMWSTRAARMTLVVVLLCVFLCPIGVSRWWMALSVGILFGPLADIAVRAADLTEMMRSEASVAISELIVIRPGSWVCVTGLALWFFDLVVAMTKSIRWERVVAS